LAAAATSRRTAVWALRTGIVAALALVLGRPRRRHAPREEGRGVRLLLRERHRAGHPGAPARAPAVRSAECAGVVDASKQSLVLQLHRADIMPHPCARQPACFGCASRPHWRPCRVLYVDIDIHHGDGVEEAFYLTDRCASERCAWQRAALSCSASPPASLHPRRPPAAESGTACVALPSAYLCSVLSDSPENSLQLLQCTVLKTACLKTACVENSLCRKPLADAARARGRAA